MLINLICAPQDAPQISPAPFQPALQPKLDGLDMRIIECARECGLTKTWSLLNALTDDEAPRNRAESRNLRLYLLAKLRRLNRLGLVFFVGRNLVSPEKPDPETALAASRRRERSVRKSRVFRAVSADSSSKCAKQQCATHPVQGTGDGSKNKSTESILEAKKTKSAPDPDEIALAARALARMPRTPPRRWTGWLHGVHMWRGAQVVLPGGQVRTVYGILRGKVVILKDPESDAFPPFELYQAEQVKRWKNPNAIVLGRLKRGIRERRSIKKLLSCWQNGRQPVGPGQRPRGRPPKRLIAPAVAKSELPFGNIR